MNIVKESAGGVTTTDYQCLSQNRIYVRAVQMTTDNYLAKYLTPIERVLGLTLLDTGTGTVSRLPFYHELGESGSGGGS